MKLIKVMAAALVAAFAMSCSQSNVKVDAELPTAAEVDSVSYLLGINVGSFLKGNGFAEESLSEINMAEFKKGITEFLQAEGTPYDPTFGEQFKINPNEMQTILNNFLTKKKEYKAAYNLAVEEAFLAENALKADVQVTESGLQYILTNEGAEYKVTPQDTVWVNYKGTLLDGTVFDENDSTKFVANRVIPGWTEGLGLMGEGGKATLYIPAELAYGERGNRTIEPNSTLVFEVEVLKVGKFVAKEEEKDTKKRK